MREYPSLIGQRFGKLVVEKQLESTQTGHRRWQCRCDCGNTYTATTASLRRGRTTNCGCKRSPDLTGQVFGRMTVIGRSSESRSRGKRTMPLWECRCACGKITYRSTDMLTNTDESMCTDCAGKHNAEIARQSAGFIGGTQLTKIRNMKQTSTNTSGCRGVYYDEKTGKYRARLKFQGKNMNFGTFDNFEDAVKARQSAEEKYFQSFIAACDA